MPFSNPHTFKRIEVPLPAPQEVADAYATYSSAILAWQEKRPAWFAARTDAERIEIEDELAVLAAEVEQTEAALKDAVVASREEWMAEVVARRDAAGKTFRKAVETLHKAVVEATSQARALGFLIGAADAQVRFPKMVNVEEAMPQVNVLGNEIPFEQFEKEVLSIIEHLDMQVGAMQAADAAGEALPEATRLHLEKMKNEEAGNGYISNADLARKNDESEDAFWHGAGARTVAPTNVPSGPAFSEHKQA